MPSRLPIPVLLECPEGFLLFQEDPDRLHVLNHSGLLAWSFLLAGNSTEQTSRLLMETYRLERPATREVQSFAETLTHLGFPDESGNSNRGRPEESLRTLFESFAAQARAGLAWVSPSILSLPFDGLAVTSAKCSARWANLDNNCCYSPSVHSQ